MNIIYFKDLGLSLLRWFLGLSIGGTLGFLLAMIGRIAKYDSRWFAHFLNFLRAIPIIGLVPVIQMNIGVNEYGKIGLIAWAVMFPVWLTIRSSISKSLQDAELMLQGAQISSWERLKIYLWPRIIGGLINGLEIGIGIAWLSVVAAEWVGTYTQGFWSGGLGYQLIINYELNNWIEVHSILLIFGVLGASTSLMWRFLVNFLFKRLHGFDPIRWLKRG